MTRLVSLAILIAVILVLGALFVMVMAQFLLPLFLALLLVVLFSPVQAWFFRKTGQRAWLAAGLTTTVIALAVLVPVLLTMGRAAAQGWTIAQGFNRVEARKEIHDKLGEFITDARERAVKIGVVIPSDDDMLRVASDELQTRITPAALWTTQFLWSFLFGLTIMLISIYFFLEGGSGMTEGVMRLIPLDPSYQQQMLDQFVSISRAVVMATLLSALAQGLLAGAGYYFAGFGNVILLVVLTMFLSMLPVVGAASVWGTCALWLYLVDGRSGAAIALALWGLCVVSTIDSVIKPLVLKGQSNLHPLLALLSVLGGVSAMGAIGIFVGPMVVSFLQALLVMLRTELDSMEKPPPKKRSRAAG